MKLEVQVIPVSDVDRSKGFYERLGWRLDDDVAPLDGLRVVQFTPPGSGTSITFGQGLTTAAPGSAEGALVVSTDVDARPIRSPVPLGRGRCSTALMTPGRWFAATQTLIDRGAAVGWRTPPAEPHWPTTSEDRSCDVK